MGTKDWDSFVWQAGKLFSVTIKKKTNNPASWYTKWKLNEAILFWMNQEAPSAPPLLRHNNEYKTLICYQVILFLSYLQTDEHYLLKYA